MVNTDGYRIINNNQLTSLPQYWVMIQGAIINFHSLPMFVNVLCVTWYHTSLLVPRWALPFSFLLVHLFCSSTMCNLMLYILVNLCNSFELLQKSELSYASIFWRQFIPLICSQCLQRQSMWKILNNQICRRKIGAELCFGMEDISTRN